MKQTLTHNPSLFLPLKRADPGNEFASERKKNCHINYECVVIFLRY